MHQIAYSKTVTKLSGAQILQTRRPFSTINKHFSHQVIENIQHIPLYSTQILFHLNCDCKKISNIPSNIMIYFNLFISRNYSSHTVTSKRNFACGFKSSESLAIFSLLFAWYYAIHLISIHLDSKLPFIQFFRLYRKKNSIGRI